MATTKKKARLSSKELEQKKQLAYVLFMAGEHQNIIAEYVNVTPKTISSWSTEKKWKEKRSAATITRPELINKILQSIGKVLDDQISGKDVGNLEDKLAKMAKTIEALDKKNNPVNAMELFTRLNKYAFEKMPLEKDLSPDFIKRMNKLQIDFVNFIMHNE